VQNLAVRRWVTRFIIATGLLVGARASAQAPPRFASPALPPDHWAVVAARRAIVLGLAPRAAGWGEGTLTESLAGWALHEASERSSSTAPALHDVIAADWQRFAREFPAVAARLAPEETRSTQTSAVRAMTASVAAGFLSDHGQVLPVRSVDRTRENVIPPERIDDLNAGDLELRLGGIAGSHVAAEAAGGRNQGEWGMRDWQLVGGVSALGAWVGKRALDYGPGAGGGIIFDGNAAFTGGGVLLATPIRLPWIFRVLGPVSGEAFLSRIDSSAASRHPWVFSSHGSISPHPRLLLGATQAFMFAGDGQPPFTFRNFKEMFLTHAIKVAGAEFENGIASVEARWRPPIPKVPAVLYAEWGSDDNHAAWFKFPAVVAGLMVASVPGVPTLSLGLERASFAAPCTTCNGCACNYYATWYRHYVFMDGWTLDREPIGHPLGGDGTEWLLYGRIDDAAHRFRVDTKAFVRDRGRYNIYSPAREGQSAGGSLGAEYRLTRSLELQAAAMLEHGDAGGGWTTSSLSARLRWVR
jgi:hypothetical protein